MPTGHGLPPGFHGRTAVPRVEQFAQVGDIRMHFQTEGQGEPMVLLMGFWGNLAWWPEPLLSYLRQHFELILVDNRGAGLSERGTMPYKIKTLADDLARGRVVDIDMIAARNEHAGTRRIAGRAAGA